MPRLRDLIIKPSKRKACTVTALDGETVLPMELRLLSSSDTSAALREARTYAEANGVKDPKPDDAMFARGRMVHTLLLACIDPDSALDKPVPFFDDVAQIERMLDDARIAYVYEEQRDYQSEYSPSPEGVRPEEFQILIGAISGELKRGAEGDPERPLGGLSARKLRSFAIQLVEQSTMWTELLSQLGSSTAASTDSMSSSTTSAESSAPQS